MTLWIAAAIALAVLGIVLLITGAARRNRGGRRLCPRCQYDLIATPRPPCPECGYTWTDEAKLFSKPASRSQRIAGMLALVLALGIVFSLPLLTGRHWVHFVPQPLLMAALNLLVDEPPIAPGAHLPAPDLALRDSRNLWERLVWQQQAALAIERFLDMVEKSGGRLEDIERLVPVANEANDLYRQYMSFTWPFKTDLWPWEYSKPVPLLTKRVRSRRAELDARFDLPLGTWAASEVQGNIPAYYSQWHPWIAPPLEIHLPLLRSSDPMVRRYALDRLAYLSASEVDAAIGHVAEEDLDREIREHAALTLWWRRGSPSSLVP